MAERARPGKVIDAHRDDSVAPRLGRRGLMLVLSSPSGAGKTTISRELLRRDENIRMSISVTTRPPRPAETDGVDYYFVNESDYRRMVADDMLLEHAQVFGHFYGTPRQAVYDLLESGSDVLFDIDWQGTQQLRQSARTDLASIFILPPSWRELERRLQNRGQDSAEVVAGRMAKASDEMSHWPEYDYIVVNEDVADSVTKVESILAAERLRRDRRVGLAEFVRRVQSGD